MSMEDAVVDYDKAMDDAVMDDTAVNNEAVVDAMGDEAEYMTWRPWLLCCAKLELIEGVSSAGCAAALIAVDGLSSRSDCVTIRAVEPMD